MLLSHFIDENIEAQVRYLTSPSSPNQTVGEPGCEPRPERAERRVKGGNGVGSGNTRPEPSWERRGPWAEGLSPGQGRAPVGGWKAGFGA